jgi:hypothetical protein
VTFFVYVELASFTFLFFNHYHETHLYLGIIMGNPGVFQANLHLYLAKPTPMYTGMGFCRYGYGSVAVISDVTGTWPTLVTSEPMYLL